MRSRFLDPCNLQVVNDSGPRPIFVTITPMSFFSERQNREYVVPAGQETDGPSIPVMLTPLIGGTPGLRAAVLHDYLVRSKSISRELADDLFLEALLSTGVDVNAAETMYRAVAAATAHKKVQSAEAAPWDLA